MKLSPSTLLAPFLASAALAAPTCKIDSTYAISGLTTRTYDGTSLAQAYFTIKATNGGTLDFECSPHDEVSGAAVDGFEAGRTYSCGENSFFYFRYTPANASEAGKGDQLLLWQDISNTETIAGSIVAPKPTICHAGGSTANDEICSWAPQQTKKIAMKTL